MGNEALNCADYPQTFADSGALGTVIIGPGFRGYMRKLKIFDHPKVRTSTEIMYRLGTKCYKFHWSQTQCEYCDVDHNFTCYTHCSEVNEWDYDCKACHSRCWSCFGDTRYHCFSCD